MRTKSSATGARVDLREIYDFTPTITQDIYHDVQALTSNRLSSFKLKDCLTYPFRGMLLCASCKQNMVVAASAGYKKYLCVRCDNKYCTRKKNLYG